MLVGGFSSLKTEPYLLFFSFSMLCAHLCYEAAGCTVRTMQSDVDLKYRKPKSMTGVEDAVYHISFLSRQGF